MANAIPSPYGETIWNQQGLTVAARKRNNYEARQRSQAIRAIIGIQPVVYAIRMPDGVIKIGSTNNLAIRCNELDGDILGFRPGTFTDEQALHQRLKPHRHHGREWYYPTPGVLAVVNEMRQNLGLKALAS